MCIIAKFRKAINVPIAFKDILKMKNDDKEEIGN